MGKKHRHKAKHEHPAKNADPPSNHPQGEDGMVYTVRIEPHPEDGKRYANEEKYRKDQLNYAKWLNWISAAGGAIAFAALVALIVTACIVHNQLMEAKRANDLAYRPYVGVNGVQPLFINKDSKGILHTDQPRGSDTIDMNIRVEIKNFGPIPALNCKSTWRIFVGGNEKPSQKFPDTPTTCFPGETGYLSGATGPIDYKNIIAGTHLVVEVTNEYDGPTGHTKECTKHQFEPDLNGFLKLGACDH